MGRSRDSADIISNGQQATAWCVFDGTLTGTNAPTDGYNVASVTRVSIGNYIVNFTTPMDNLNWSTSIEVRLQNSSIGSYAFMNDFNTPRTLSTQSIYTSNTAASAGDAKIVCVQVFGGKD